MSKVYGVVLISFLISLLSGCTMMTAVQKNPGYVVGDAAVGCGVGALMTLWSGPIAAIGCGMGAIAATGGGMMLSPMLPP